VEKDYWKKYQDLFADTSRVLKQTKPEQFTKEFTQRLRMKRDMNAPMAKAGHEYGDYEAYADDVNRVDHHSEKNSTDLHNESFYKNYQSMIKSMNTKDGEELRSETRKNIAATIEDMNIGNEDVTGAFNRLQSEQMMKLNMFQIQQEA
jgi:hypothetical protein